MTRTRKSGLIANTPSSKKDKVLIELDNVAHNSGDEVSQTPESKRLKGTPLFASPEFESRFSTMELGTRNLITAPLLDSKIIAPLTDVGIIKLFEDVGIDSFILNLPKVYYPDLVREYYANLHSDKFGNICSTVNGKKIQFNTSLFSSILDVDYESELDVYTAQTALEFPDFSVKDQLSILIGSDLVGEFAPPSTTEVTPLAHLIFKLVRSHICPRMGNKSNFTNQDVVLVAMILAGRKFDLSSLIMQKMLSTLDKTSTGIPYAQVLTKVFSTFRIDVKKALKINVKEVFDHKTLTQNNIQLVDGLVTRILPPPSSVDLPEIGEPSNPTPATSEFTSTESVSELKKELQAVKKALKVISCDCQTIKTVMKGFHKDLKLVRDLLLKPTGTTSASHSAVDTDLGLEKLAQAAAKDAPEEEEGDTDKEGDEDFHVAPRTAPSES